MIPGGDGGVGGGAAAANGSEEVLLLLRTLVEAYPRVVLLPVVSPIPLPNSLPRRDNSTTIAVDGSGNHANRRNNYNNNHNHQRDPNHSAAA